MTAYGVDVIAWANEQATLLRSGKLSEIDIEHIANEIESVGKSEQREFAFRVSKLIFNLLKWRYKPSERTTVLKLAIFEQRKSVERRLKKTPSLRSCFDDAEWIADAWCDSVSESTDISDLPSEMPWNTDQIMNQEFFPI